ncbi:MAG: nucleotidyltransferase family protein [Chloroflexi bacterium]|nr:nucleotidyltransferase family protein [Chloroflexota bacterium]
MISAVILAAGQSRRMGQPKMLLPWGNTTVIGHVIQTLRLADILDVLVVTGGVHEQVSTAVLELHANTVFNENYHSQELLSSIQCGLRWLPPETAAALICLGDQPQIQELTVRRICQAYLLHGSPLIVPSYRMRRGHPWLIGRSLWNSLLELDPSGSPREFINENQNRIEYVVVDSPSVIEDLDTPENYQNFKP